MKKNKTNFIAIMGLLTACVVVLQLLPIRLGMFQLALVGIPIILGSILYGALAGGFLGLVFGIVVLFNGDATAFFTFNALGTIITVLLKGTIAGFFTGLVYKLFKKTNYFSILLTSLVFPIANTSVFVIGCYSFFMPLITTWATDLGLDAQNYIVYGLIGLNFIVETLVTVIFSIVIYRVINKKILPQENIKDDVTTGA